MISELHDSAAFNRNLCETVEWCCCASQLTDPTKDPEIAEHFARLERASALFGRASAGRNWFRRNVINSVDWQAGSQLIKDAAPLVSSLTKRFRQSELARDIETSIFRPSEEWNRLVLSVIEKRRDTLRLDRPSIIDTRGRLLVCEPLSSVADAASQYSSAGYFDENDVPPADTWVHFDNGKLVCWVPQPLVSLAQRGIDTNAVECIYWE